MTDLTILPLSIVMVAGPQIITAVFLATSSSWGRNTAVFLGGAAISISLFVTAGFLIGGSGDVDTSETLSQVLDVVSIALLILAGIYVYRRRKKSEPPSWMGKLQTATPRLAFKLGFLLLGFFPTDIVTSLTVGRYLAREGASLWDGIPFVLLTLLLLALPALSVLLLGERGRAFLPKAREWMAANSWIISEAVIVFFIIVIW
jgi:threonine/homoserine/homoserine lactone efflux protein